MVRATGSLLTFAETQRPNHHCASFLRSVDVSGPPFFLCLRSPPAFPAQLPLSPCLPLPYHYLGYCSLRRGAVWYHIVACTVFTTGLFWCGGTAFASYERCWIVTSSRSIRPASDSQSSYTGMDTLWYVFCGRLLGRVPGSRSHASSQFEVGCLSACSPRASSQVNGRSSPRYDSRSRSQSRRICIPRRLWSGGSIPGMTNI